jgi:hypothetical protein
MKREAYELTASDNPIKKKALEILPIDKDTIENPDEFAIWLYAHSPIILKALFEDLPELAPRDRAKILLDLFKTTVSHKPYSKVHFDRSNQNGQDVVDYLKRMMSGEDTTTKE